MRWGRDVKEYSGKVASMDTTMSPELPAGEHSGSSGDRFCNGVFCLLVQRMVLGGEAASAMAESVFERWHRRRKAVLIRRETWVSFLWTKIVRAFFCPVEDTLEETSNRFQA